MRTQRFLVSGLMVAAGLVPLSANPASATTLCFGKPPTIVGTERSEHLVGTAGNDVIVARGGNDRITGHGGNDRICGNAGRDLIGDLSGDTRTDGGLGRDIIDVGGGNSVVDGGPGRDYLSSFASVRLVMYGRAGDDQLQSPRQVEVTRHRTDKNAEREDAFDYLRHAINRRFRDECHRRVGNIAGPTHHFDVIDQCDQCEYSGKYYQDRD